MPYIDENERDKFEKDLNQISHNILTMGEMNYCISTMVSNFLERIDEIEGKVGYHHYNQLIGVLECAKLELYRRLIAPYEDVKIIDDGDVYFGQE